MIKKYNVSMDENMHKTAKEYCKRNGYTTFSSLIQCMLRDKFDQEWREQNGL